jgi:hypothetical protein
MSPMPDPTSAAEIPAATNGSALLSTVAGLTLLAINPQVRPYKVTVPTICVAHGEQYVSQIRICASAAGTVSQVEILKPSLPIIDEQLPEVIARWRFRPYLIEGRSTPFCYIMHYRVR